MKHSVSFMAMIVPQLGHSLVAPLGGPRGAVGGAGARAAGGTALGGAARAGATGGGGAAACSFFRRFATRKNRRAMITTARMIPRRPPITTMSRPPPALIENAPLWAIREPPSASMTVRTITASDASMPGAGQLYVPAPLENPVRGPATVCVCPPDV